MPRIKTTQGFRNLKGEAMKSRDPVTGAEEATTLGQILAEVILSPHKDKKGFRPLKSLELARKFYGEGAQEQVEVDNADFSQIRELVENHEAYAVIVIAQALQMLDEAGKE